MHVEDTQSWVRFISTLSGRHGYNLQGRRPSSFDMKACLAGLGPADRNVIQGLRAGLYSFGPSPRDADPPLGTANGL